ncbi:type II secretion system F family protein [Acidaminobacter hydrogenoformans]|nr:type II secretion system F family protein [Acidaminobacter hydrogenoformans]
MDSMISTWIYFAHPGFLLPVLVVKLPALSLQAQMIAVKTRETFLSDFAKFLSALAATASTGKSLHGAFDQTVNEFSSPCSALEIELRRLRQLMSLGTPCATGLERMAMKFGLDEAADLASHIQYAETYGYSMPDVLKRSSDWIGGQIRHKRQMTSQMTEKVMEFRLTSKMPLLILLILNITYPDYLSALYTTTRGRGLVLIAAASLEAGVFLFDRTRLNQLKSKGLMGF